MRLLIYVSLLLIVSNISLAAVENKYTDNIKEMSWDGIPIVWLQDERFPTYKVTVYFADGSLSDAYKEKGMTNAMFELLTSGTTTYTQKVIHDNLEYFGVSYGGKVSHENSTYSFSGLVKDLVPTAKKICHLFGNATYPKKELKRSQNRWRSVLGALVNSKEQLASRAFRELSLKGSPYSYPVTGKQSDIRRVTTKKLRKKLKYFNEKVAKKIFITGPRSMLKLKEVIKRDCPWGENEKPFFRSLTYNNVKKKTAPKIYLVTVPKSNQAQVRIGRFLNKGEFENLELLELTSAFLGGGFTSRLSREVRVKRGLTYSISAFAAGQKDYGRAGISTFTKNETVKELLDTVKSTLEGVKKGEYDIKDFNTSKSYLKGSYPFRFESSSNYLNQLVYYKHVGMGLERLRTFPKLVEQLNSDDVNRLVTNLFDWNQQVIVVLGSKTLLKQLKKFGPVKVVSYKKFL
jgi:zinc protease